MKPCTHISGPHSSAWTQEGLSISYSYIFTIRLTTYPRAVWPRTVCFSLSLNFFTHGTELIVLVLLGEEGDL